MNKNLLVTFGALLLLGSFASQAQQTWNYSTPVNGITVTTTYDNAPPWGTTTTTSPLTGEVTVQLVLTGPAIDPVLQSIMLSSPLGTADLDITSPTSLGGETYSIGSGPNVVTLLIGASGFTGASIVEANSIDPAVAFSLNSTGVSYSSSYGNSNGTWLVFYGGPASTWTAAPELDATSGLASLTLLCGAIVVIRGRRT
jgi:hypothetical protein